MTTWEPVPRRQLDESHSGVSPEPTTTEVNLEPRSTRHGRLLVETAPTTKVTRSPSPYRCRAERMVSRTAPPAQVRRPGLEADEGLADGRARGRVPRSAVSRVAACQCPRSPREPGPELAAWPAEDRGDPWPGAWLPPSALFTAQTGRPSTATPTARTTTRRRQ